MLPTRFRPFFCQPSSVLPYYMCPILNPKDHTNALECTLEGALAFDLWLYHAVLQCLAFLTSYKVPTAALCCLLTFERSLALHAECTCPCILCISLMDKNY